MRRRDPNPDWSCWTVSAPALAGFFGVSEAVVFKWGRVDGMPRSPEKGRYPFRECVLWRVARLTESGDPNGIAEERRQLIHAQRIGQELHNAKARAAVIDADLAVQVMGHLENLIAARLDELPKLAGELAHHRDPTVINRLIFGACRTARERMAGDVAAYAQSLAGTDG